MRYIIYILLFSFTVEAQLPAVMQQAEKTTRIRRLDTLITPPSQGGGGNPTGTWLTNELLPVTHEWILADYHTVQYEAAALFDSVLNTTATFTSNIWASPPYEVIPNTGLNEQIIIIDLQGRCKIDSIWIRDVAGVTPIQIWTAKENIFDVDSVTQINLSLYLAWRKVPIGDTLRYVMLRHPLGSVNGIGEVAVYGSRIDAIPEPSGYVVNKKVKDQWGVTTHDYDHVESLDSAGIQNIYDANFFNISRTYVESVKTWNQKTLNLIKSGAAAGAFDINQLEKFADKGGELLLSFVGTPDTFTNSFPAAAYDGVPMFYWDENLTGNENRARQFDPENWQPLRDMMMQVASYIHENNLDTVAIIQLFNELDKTWQTGYHRLNPFMVAAAYSVFWDGHEGQFGYGIKDSFPEIRVAWMAQAYNNVGYMKMAKQWFETFRSDSVFCADMISVNSYCTNKLGFQWSANAHAIPPENTEWLHEIERTCEFSHSMGLPCILSEFGADATAIDWNLNRVFIDDSVDVALHELIDNQGDSLAGWLYDNVFWPEWDSIILYRQANYNARYMLTASEYADYLMIYHMRDNFEPPWDNQSTYSSTGIAFRVDRIARGNIQLKPSGELLKSLFESLGEYSLISTDVNGSTWTQTYRNDLGQEKQVQWTTDVNSQPQILE
jgi:hypothetical protein